MIDKKGVSIICTVKNEQETIHELLESMGRQSVSANEIVIVDGGSSDNTVGAIESYANRLPIRLIVCPDANIATGRNMAIRNAKYDLIASTDGGCRLDSDWLRNIVKPFEESETDVVSGVYVSWFDSELGRIASELIFPRVEEIKADKFLPSGRSVAFRKEAWKKVGGYPEWLDSAEDTLFDLKLRKAQMKFALAQKAIVQWKVRKNVKEIFKQFYNYAKGEGSALLFPVHYLARYAAFIVFFLFAAILWHNVTFWLFAVLATVTSFWIRHLRRLKRPSFKDFVIAFRVALAIEAGLTFGYLNGMSSRINKRGKIH